MNPLRAAPSNPHAPWARPTLHEHFYNAQSLAEGVVISRPPRLAEAILRRLLPPDEQGAVLGDLREEYGRWILPARGRVSADAWYWRQVLSSIAPTLRRRRLRLATHPRPYGKKTMNVLETAAVELRHAWRTIAARPLHTGLSVVTLALGIGGTAAIASVAQQALLEPLPYPHDRQLVSFWDRGSWSAAEFTDLRGRFDGFDDVAAWRGEESTLRSGDEPARVVTTARGSSELFDVLGVSPARGRMFRAGDDAAGAEPIAVVTHGFWVREMGGAPDVLGQRVALDGVSRTIVGVMPEGFYFPDPSVELWVPLELDPGDRAGMLALVGRVSGSRDPETMAPELARISEKLRAAFQYQNPDWDRTRRAALTPLRSALRGDVGPSILLAGGAMILILLVACANVAALTAVRTSGRLRELSIRTALGAGRGAVARQLILESMLVATLGAAAGAALAASGFSLLTAWLPVPAGAPPVAGVEIFGFAFLIASAVGLGVGAVPATSILRGRLGRALSTARGTGTAGRGRLASGLVVVEVTLAVFLVTGAGLLIRSVRALAAIDTGFDASGVLALDVVMGAGEMDISERRRALDALVERIEAVPGVASVGAIQKLPLRGNGWTTGFRVEDRPAERFTSAFRVVTPGYLQAMGIRVVEGRATAPTDLPESAPVVVVNQTLARDLWPGESAVGKRVTSGFGSTWATVVGVVADVRVYGLTDAGVGARYQLYRQAGVVPEGNTLVVRAGTDRGRIVEDARAAIHDVDPRIAIGRVERMEAVARDARGRVEDLVFLLSILGALALTLGSIGVYGVVSDHVQRRTGEWGVRMALGQQPTRMVGMILARGLGLVGLGVVGGVLLSLLGARSLAPLLYQVGPHDPVAFGAAAAVLAAAGAISAFVPAVRAGRVDPVVSLREE